MVGLTWKWIFGESFGIVNFLLSQADMKPILWSSAAGPAFWTTVIANVWADCGVNMLIFIGGIKQIPISLHEAARIDGASKWQDFIHVTLPSLSPVSFMVIIMSVVNSFKVFAMVQTLTNGGPGTATTYMIQYIYNTGFNKMKVGYSCAASMLMFLILMIISIIQTKVDAKLNER
jgi:alpha-1,4-digalacturonate transport system permease protein